MNDTLFYCSFHTTVPRLEDTSWKCSWPERWIVQVCQSVESAITHFRNMQPNRDHQTVKPTASELSLDDPWRLKLHPQRLTCNKYSAIYTPPLCEVPFVPYNNKYVPVTLQKSHHSQVYIFDIQYWGRSISDYIFYNILVAVSGCVVQHRLSCGIFSQQRVALAVQFLHLKFQMMQSLVTRKGVLYCFQIADFRSFQKRFVGSVWEVPKKKHTN